MDLILCHTTADFDCLGAAVGLTLLRPGARIVLPGGAHPAVRDFLALHRDEFPLIERRSVSPERIRSLAVVDAQEANRLGVAAEWLTLPQLQEIAVYDHHLGGDRDIPSTQVTVEAVGATTTLIVEALQRACLRPNVMEATAMALGIHVDTGSLTYEQATVRDAQALAWLMAQGANLGVIRDSVERGLSPELQDLLAIALDDLTVDDADGRRLGWVLLRTDGYCTGLSSLTAQLMEIVEVDALLLGVHYPLGDGEERLTVIGRSRIDGTDLAALFRPYGGGGHAFAATLTRRENQARELLVELQRQLLAQLPPPLRARELMSSPVRTIRPDTKIADAERTLLRYGHSGLSVVNEHDRLVGVISRRDLDIALHHGFGHAPVRGYMTQNPRTIGPDASLERIEELMVTYDIGRLPVLDGDRLVGIVTRTDVLRQLHRQQQQRHPQGLGPGGLPLDRTRQQLQQRLVPDLWQFLATAATLAEDRGWHLYLVGGGVRDLLLADSDQPLALADIDLVVDGYHAALTDAAGVELAQALRDRYPAARLEVHGQFQTAALLWHQDPQFDYLWVDIATARTEFYPYPAANPEVEACSIQQDLYRRDFTVNALALRLTEPRAGELLDFFGGLLDLQSRRVRVLHPNSFIEDPTRIFRAVRFAVKLGFDLEGQTVGYIRYAIDSGVYERTQGENGVAPALQTRLRAELNTILAAPYWQAALGLLGDLQALRCLHPQLRLTPALQKQVRIADRGWRWFAEAQASDRPRLRPTEAPLEHWLLLLETLLAAVPESQGAAIARRLQLPHESITRLERLESVTAAVRECLPGCDRPSQVHAALQAHEAALLLLVLARLAPEQRRTLWCYLTRWMGRTPPLDGNDLRELGYRPGRLYRDILADLLARRLDGEFPPQPEAERQAAIAYVTATYPR